MKCESSELRATSRHMKCESSELRGIASHKAADLTMVSAIPGGLYGRRVSPGFSFIEKSVFVAIRARSEECILGSRHGR